MRNLNFKLSALGLIKLASKEELLKPVILKALGIGSGVGGVLGAGSSLHDVLLSDSWQDVSDREKLKYILDNTGKYALMGAGAGAGVGGGIDLKNAIKALPNKMVSKLVGKPLDKIADLTESVLSPAGHAIDAALRPVNHVYEKGLNVADDILSTKMSPAAYVALTNLMHHPALNFLKFGNFKRANQKGLKKWQRI